MNRFQTVPFFGQPDTGLARLEALAAHWLARHSVALLRISLGLVFLGFGLLKFVPGLSPAEALAERTLETMSFGLVSGRVALLLIASLETIVGLCLVTGLFLRLGLALLAPVSAGIMAPLVLFPGELFSGRFNAPTLEAQYVLKDVVLLAAVLVVAARTFGRRPTDEGADRAVRRGGDGGR